jgi:hypothetical protein
MPPRTCARRRIISETSHSALVAIAGGGAVANAGDHDIFVASYSSTGAFRWATPFGATGADEGLGVAADGSGSVAVTGYFNSTVSFGGGSLTSAGGSDIFLLKLAP